MVSIVSFEVYLLADWFFWDTISFILFHDRIDLYYICKEIRETPICQNHFFSFFCINFQIFARFFVAIRDLCVQNAECCVRSRLIVLFFFSLIKHWLRTFNVGIRKQHWRLCLLSRRSEHLHQSSFTRTRVNLLCLREIWRLHSSNRTYIYILVISNDLIACWGIWQYIKLNIPEQRLKDNKIISVCSLFFRKNLWTNSIRYINSLHVENYR